MENKGIWLPIEIINDKETTFQEKLILMEINQLSMLDKGCFASNNHFAELFKVKKETVSRAINSLQKKGYISVEIKPGSRNHDRRITINKLLSHYKQNVIAPLTNCSETKENKTINKTINILIDISAYPKVNELAATEWLEHKKYKTKAPITKTLNFLTKYSYQEQQEIVDTSIMNGYKGLFPPKQKKFQDKKQGRYEAIDEAFEILGTKQVEVCDYEQ